MSDHIVVLDSAQPFGPTCDVLAQAVSAHGFSVIGNHNLGETLRGKGLSFPEECRVFEVCEPHQAARVLGADLQLSTALPCRISVYTEAGRTKVAMVRPQGLLQMLSSDPALAAVAGEVEAAILAIIREAAGQR